MRRFFKGYRIPFFVFALTAAILSFNGSFSGDKDPDVIEAEYFLLNNTVITPNFDNKITSLITPVQQDRPFTFNSPFTVADTMILPANPGPANNGGSPNWAMFLDLIGGTRDLYVTAIKTSSTAAAGGPISFEVLIRDGSTLGGTLTTGPGSSPAGWTAIDTASGIQGPTTNGISELIYIGPIPVAANDTVGVALRFITAGPRYFGTGTPPIENYNDTNIRLRTGEGRSAPFTPTGSFFTSRALTGEIRYVVSTTTGITNLNTGVPNDYKLSQNFPNPFNPETNIQFAIPEKNNVTLKVFNIQGQEVAVLANGEYAAGTYMVNWNAADMSSGVYFYTIQTGNFTQTKKLLLVK